MKSKSEKLREEAAMEDNDLSALGKYTKAIREERGERFEDNWLEKLREKTYVSKRENGSYTFDSEFGIIDFFPKSNKLLIRSQNKWKKPGLRFIIKNIINK